MKYQCVRCGKIKETKQEMLTCSGSCRVAYHRYLKAGNPPIDPIRIDDGTKNTILQIAPYWLRNSDCKGFIYVIKELDITGYYKIGMTNSWSNRKRVFGIQLPFEWKIVHVFKVKNMQRAEVELHNKFANKHVKGEWFDLDDADIEYIKSLEDE